MLSGILKSYHDGLFRKFINMELKTHQMSLFLISQTPSWGKRVALCFFKKTDFGRYYLNKIKVTTFSFISK